MTSKAKQWTLVGTVVLSLATLTHGAKPGTKSDAPAAAKESTEASAPAESHSAPSASASESVAPAESAKVSAPPAVAAGASQHGPARPVRLPVPRALRGQEINEEIRESAAGEPDINTSLDTTSMAQQIRVATINDRPILLDALAERLAAGDEELLETKRIAGQLQWQARKQYRAALKEYKLRRNQLDYRIAEARRARPENWAEVKNGLSGDYQAYWATLTRLTGFATGVVP